MNGGNDTGLDIDSNAANDDEKSQSSDASSETRGPYILAWDKDKYFQTLLEREQKEWSYHLQFTIGYRYYAVSTLADEQQNNSENHDIQLRIF